MVKIFPKKLANNVHDWLFRAVHDRCLIYNICWEDSRIDRQILDLNRNSKVVMLTSAGCNTLDYLLDFPAEIHTVDVNPRQNALLHLKLALIKRGNFDDLFAMFGLGSHSRCKDVYSSIKAYLPHYAQTFWDEKIEYFATDSKKKSFYYYGTSGAIAWILKKYMLHSEHKKDHVFDLLNAQTLQEQKEIYSKIEPILWGKFSAWLVKQPMTMAMLGVPRPQIRLIDSQYEGGIWGYVNKKLKHVLTEVLIKDNYFWRVYLTGCYTENCCPNYLKKKNLHVLSSQINTVNTYNSTVSEFLKSNPGCYSHFVLLDHQDWLAWHDPRALEEEWQLILQNSSSSSKILMRSASTDINFLPHFAKSSLRFFPELTNALHTQDRVGTYGSLHLAEVL